MRTMHEDEELGIRTVPGKAEPSFRHDTKQSRHRT
uniref:Uncharacterized protein n=1 Tax=Rhizophora mucronata TaxID=61149 RepID=A0A2P2NFD4_RHIMU